MSIRLAPLAALPILGCAILASLALSHGQEPAPAAKRLPAAPPVRLTPPAALPERTPPKPTRNLARLKPLERQLYLTAHRGASWLDRMNQKKGSFVHGWLPALNQPMEGEPALRQAGAAFALARAARYLQDEGCTARAAQAVLALLEDTTLSADKTHRYPTQPSTLVNRVSAAGLLVLAISELPAAEDTQAASEQLCEFLRRQQQKDGSIVMCESVAGGPSVTIDADQAGQYAGQALYALVRSQERKPAAWKLDVVKKAMPTYMKWWREHKQRELVLWHSAAYAEAFLLTKDKAFAEAVLEMNDWLCTLQHERLDPAHPQWLGGFQNAIDGKLVNSPPDISTAI
jgi:hypothetical protein